MRSSGLPTCEEMLRKTTIIFTDRRNVPQTSIITTKYHWHLPTTKYSLWFGPTTLAIQLSMSTSTTSKYTAVTSITWFLGCLSIYINTCLFLRTVGIFTGSWQLWRPSYYDISIFKIAAVRHLGIVLPPHETTHEVSVAGRSCLSNFMSIWYTDLKI